MTWNYVCVKRSFYIAQNFVIDSLGAGRLQNGVAQKGHVFQELGAVGSDQGVEVCHDRVRQEQAVAMGDLGIAQHRPS